MNNNIPRCQCDELKNDSIIDGLKLQKKDRLLAITFSEIAGIRLYMNTCKVPELLF